MKGSGITSSVIIPGVVQGPNGESHGITSSLVVASPVPWPSITTGVVTWYDMLNSGSITQSGGKVSQLLDLSGAGNHATQATGTNQFTYNPTAINGHPGLENTANSNSIFMNTVNTLAFAPFTLCAVIVDYSGSAETTTIGYSAGGSGYFAWPYLGNRPGGGHVYNTFEFYDGGSGDLGFNSSGVGSTNTPWSIAVAMSTYTPITITALLMNGTDYSSSVTGTGGNANATKLASAKFLGANTINSYSTYNGALGELVLFNRALTISDMQNWHTYVKAKWGTP